MKSFLLNTEAKYSPIGFIHYFPIGAFAFNSVVIMDMNETELNQFRNLLLRFLGSESLSVKKDRKKLKEFIPEILTYYREQRSTSTARGVETALTHLLDYLGNVFLDEIELRKIEMFFISLMKKAPKGSYNYLRYLRACFNKGIEWNYINSNPFDKIRLPKRQKSEPIYLNRNELEKLLSKITNKRLKDLILFVFLTGLRAGEVVTLTWNFVDLSERKIQIGSDNFKTKSRKVRFIPLSNEAIEILLINRPKVFKIDERQNFVFTMKNRFPFSTDYISKQFKKAVREAGLNEGLHFHSLRHSFASTLARKGVSLYKIQKLLGHSNFSTVQIYASLDLDSLREAVSVLDNNIINNKKEWK